MGKKAAVAVEGLPSITLEACERDGEISIVLLETGYEVYRGGDMDAARCACAAFWAKVPREMLEKSGLRH